MSQEPPIESGVAETEMNTTVTPVDADGNPLGPTVPLRALEAVQDAPSDPEVHEVLSEPAPAPGPVFTAKLTADETNEVRARIEATDFLVDEVKARRESMERQAKELRYVERSAAASQRDLTGYVQVLIRRYGLADGMQYRVDPEQAAILPVGPSQQ